MKALWNNTIIAESNDTIEIEGSSYFPIDSVNLHLLKRSKHQSFCSWKGTAHYYSINIEDHTNTNAAWFYPSPFEKAIVIKGHIAFWKGVECIDD